MDEKLTALVADIRKLYKGARIMLFGSRARGMARKDSDYDLIIISKKFGRTPFVNRAGVIWRNSWVVIAADLLCYTPEEFARVSKESFIIKDALKHAVAL
ncbi:MAG: nucleotidyltransferase domain-containing protein [Candidatus Micrarchaeota archaeon]